MITKSVALVRGCVMMASLSGAANKYVTVNKRPL